MCYISISTFSSSCFPELVCSVVDPDLDWIRILWGPWIVPGIRVSGSRRAKMTHKHRKKYKILKISFFEVLDVLF
jgi:hypothetical protein